MSQLRCVTRITCGTRGGSLLFMTTQAVIGVSGIRKTYGRTVAVDEVSFEVAEGEIFGLIGPNGAGKTTTMECVEGLRTPDRGAISVLSLDPFRDISALAQLMKRTFWLMGDAESETYIRHRTKGLAVVCDVIAEKSDAIESMLDRVQASR